jgi:hypothetical protein
MVARTSLCTFAAAALACTANPPPPRDEPASEPVAPAVAEKSPEQELRERTGFPRPPRGTAPNCGPEQRFATRPIDSRETFLAVVRERLAAGEGGDVEVPLPPSGAPPDRPTAPMPWLRLDNFRRPPPDDELYWWTMIAAAVTVEDEGGVTYYRLEFTPRRCDRYTLTLTSVGAGALYGCCGK